ncbi:MAG: hypothetical protein P4M11_12695 [Candidatus Pacebacteria bacterium]|nr:hypothetical protein [Candidatus Paceibacterota bacterium]
MRRAVPGLIACTYICIWYTYSWIVGGLACLIGLGLVLVMLSLQDVAIS